MELTAIHLLGSREDQAPLITLATCYQGQNCALWARKMRDRIGSRQRVRGPFFNLQPITTVRQFYLLCVSLVSYFPFSLHGGCHNSKPQLVEQTSTKGEWLCEHVNKSFLNAKNETFLLLNHLYVSLLRQTFS